MDDSPSGSSIPGILQARILEWVAISFFNACMHVKLLQLCPTLCKPMDSSPPGSSVHRILEARILEWVAISFSNGELNLPLRILVNSTYHRSHFTGFRIRSLHQCLPDFFIIDKFKSFSFPPSIMKNRRKRWRRRGRKKRQRKNHSSFPEIILHCILT